MKRTSQLLMGLSLFSILFVVSMPGSVQAHGGIGGFHAGGVHVGGVHAAGFHAGGVRAGGGFNHVGYYPHYNAGVGYYHPVARAAAWSAAYNGGGYGYGGYNPYPYNSSFYDGSAVLGGISGFGNSQAGDSTQQQLEADLKKDNDK
jgi:hypothetical protein